ncbi:unnamed protein product [Dimorphilus gyrociliatus]|uniref:Uncharacterized protein n=1 Tax=Dimorphilus gyrociliatus TaxID=2664684 RepID=A0A7I8VY78_9ANNE|nr:unnamed protein product [Dimorphilus gyrociliatus]
MDKATKRLSSYKQCKMCKCTFAQLAYNGYYYFRDDDSIACHKCAVKHFCFYEKDMTDLKHKTTCEYYKDSPQSAKKEKAVLSSNDSENKLEFQYNELSDVPSAASSNPLRNQSQSVQQARPKPNRYGKSAQDSPEMPTKAAEKNLNASYTFDNSAEDLSREKDRLNTFTNPKNPWPLKSVIDEKELARVGFFYLGLADRVQCYFCNGILRKWSLGDKPLDEHKKHFPNCPHLRNCRE